MNARTSWSAKTGQQPDERTDEAAMPLDDLLEARFDEQGRLSQVGGGARQRVAERLEARPPTMSPEELERAVEKLARGLEAIEMQGGRPAAKPVAKASAESPVASSPPTERSGPRGRDFVTYSLDRLEARLDALSKRMEQRTGTAPADAAVAAGSETSATHGEARPQGRVPAADPTLTAATRTEPVLAVEPREPAKAQRGAGPGIVAPDVHREAEAEREVEGRAAAEAKAAADELRQAERAAEVMRMAALEGARRRAEADAARQAEADAARKAEEARHRAQAAEEQLRIEAEARHDAEIAAADLKRQFILLEGRIETLQRNFDDNQIEPVRHELMEVLRDMEELGRDGRSVAGAVEQMRKKLDEVETKLNASRNMTGNRIGELQDRLLGLTQRLSEIEAEVPGFDALRENQSAILERFDRIEGLVQRSASPDELFQRVDTIRKHLQGMPSQREVARIEEQILHLADRLDTLPGDLSDRAVLERIEGQLHAVASEFSQSRRQRQSGTADLEARLDDLAARLQDLREADHAPDLSPLEERLSQVAARLDETHRTSGDALARFEKRLAGIASSLEKQEDDASAEILAALTDKMDALAAAVDGQDARGDIGALDRKLDAMQEALAEQGERISKPQLEPLEERLDRLQTQLDQIGKSSKASTAQFGPFASKLHEISDRLSGLVPVDNSAISERLAAIEDRLAGIHTGKGPDTRALQTQLEGIVSRLELLKGRSIDPARLNELFDRLDAATRAGGTDDRFDRIEEKLDGGLRFESIEERFDRLERKLDSVGLAPDDRFDRLEEALAASAGFPAERFDRLEQKLEASGRGIPAERLDQFERALAAGADAPNERFSRLEDKLDQIGQAYSAGMAGELLNQEDLADLRSDIVALRRELRSLPGLGDGEGNLSALLQTISGRLERLPDEPPATARELDDRMERIAELLEDPSQNRLALAHIEATLRSIEERLEETRRELLSRPDREINLDSGDLDAGTVAGFARSLSDDVTALKGATEVSERKTRDALDAVQDTLEAVVKRMAFLERDADMAAAAEANRPVGALRLPAREEPDPVVEPPVIEPAEIATIDEMPPASLLGEAGAEEPKPPLAREAGSGGLFSRFTSSQLLKRATGGRAESFSPDSEEGDDAPDLPLEPGTNSPLASALTDAPSSDTVLMSGGRSKGKADLAPAPRADVDLGRSRRSPAEPIAGDDFLAAARRAAQAASAEAAEAEREAEDARARSGLSRLAGMVKARRRVILASALVLAVAFAALQMVRGQMGASDGQLADAEPAPAEVAFAKPDLAAKPIQRRAPAGPVAASTSTSTAGSVATPSAGLAAQPAADAAPAARPETPTVTASLSEEPDAADLVPVPTIPSAAVEEASAPPVADLPDEIGPPALREAALAGDPEAAFEVASRLAEGRGVSQDMNEAVAWYERASEGGLAPAQYRLGSIYEKGLGVPKDPAKAQDWYQRSADGGNVKAMHNLAVLYAEGAGGTPDLERAAGLFRQAAEHGVRDSQFNLAILHARGLGVPQDMVEAYKWFAVAAGSGDAESIKRRDIIAGSLAPADLARGEAAAEAFQPAPLVTGANDVEMPEGGWGEESPNVQLTSATHVVALVQELLNERGYETGPADGVFGNRTRRAISEFQEQAGLPVTGEIDAGLVAALQEQST